MDDYFEWLSFTPPHTLKKKTVVDWWDWWKQLSSQVCVEMVVMKLLIDVALPVLYTDVVEQAEEISEEFLKMV